MKAILEAINHPSAAFQNRHSAVSWGLVSLTVLINSLLEPSMRQLFSANAPCFDGWTVLTKTALGILSYLVFCLSIGVVCRCFGSKTPFIHHIKAWGITFVPTAVCAIAVTFTEIFFYVFWNSTLWGLLLNVVFGGVLFWKVILCFLYVSTSCELKGMRLVWACAIIGVIALGIAALNGFVGLKAPVI